VGQRRKPGPLTREEADRAYRSLRRSILAGVACVALAALVSVMAGLSSAVVLVGAAALYTACAPMVLRSLRRGIDERAVDDARTTQLPDLGL
jgi:hypothetical protein